MDEVDIEDLESRLYGQIHHESVSPNSVAAESIQSDQQPPDESDARRLVTATSMINKPAGSSKVPSTRYWNVSGRNAYFPNNSTAVKNIPAKTSDQKPKETVSKKDSTTPQNSRNRAEVKNTPDKTPRQRGNEVGVKKDSITPKTPVAAGGAPLNNQAAKTTPLSNTDNSRKANSPRNSKAEANAGDFNNSSDIRINPIAALKNRKAKKGQKKRQRQQQQQPPQPPTAQQGFFAQRELKLQKAVRWEAKKQKSKIAQNKRNAKPIETIVVESSSSESSSSGSDSDSDSDDVILLPAKNPPIITVNDSDSDSEEEMKVENVKEEGATTKNSTDNKMENFAKPPTQKSLSEEPVVVVLASALAPAPVAEQEPSSRCNSPSSVLSSDDFIVQNDRSRLQETGQLADDEDLQLLSAEVDSLMHAPQAIEDASRNSSSNEVICVAEFVAPLDSDAAQHGSGDYRVEQTQFRALDVYESESDITDGVYSKLASKPTTSTVIRTVDDSSEGGSDIEDATTIGQKTKKLRKRRESGNLREAETGSEDDDDDDDTAGVASTGVPFISRGPAVESRKRSISLGSKRALGGRRSLSGSGGQMSDSEFLATLNSLAQANSDEGDDSGDEDEDEEEEGTPSAREIAEKILGRANEANERASVANQSSEQNAENVDESSNNTITAEDEADVSIISTPITFDVSLEEAIPDNAVDGLDRVFEVIDNLDKNRKGRGSARDPIDVSDASDKDLEIVVNPLAESVTKSKEENAETEPKYFVVYTRNAGDDEIGWNDEMSRFYNKSWKGENFSLRELQQRMNHSRDLWKIYSEDRFPKSRQHSNLKCYNCCEFGHTRAKCKRPKKPAICYMCGESGHYEPRCPNTMCLRCGNKTHVFVKSCNACSFQNRLICPICKVRGHTVNLCPDKWRRYHSTVGPNKYPNSSITYNQRKMCCICGSRGHLSDTCRSALRFMEYPIIINQVKSHEKSYRDTQLKFYQVGIAINLLYKPDEKITFDLAEKTKANKCYGRFLNSVGLGHLLTRKRRNSISNTGTVSKRRKERQANNSTQSNAQLMTSHRENAPDQVQEVSGSNHLEESVNLNTALICNDSSIMDTTERTENDVEDLTICDGILEPDEPSGIEVVTVEMNENNFKSPTEVTRMQQPQPQLQLQPQPQQQQEEQEPTVNEPLPMDSDSNYSFSEHFETLADGSNRAEAAQTVATLAQTTANVATSTNQAIKPVEPAITTPTTALQTSTASIDSGATASSSSSNAVESRSVAQKPRELSPLPDFIPLTGDLEDDDNDVDLQAGISRRFVVDESTDNEANGGSGSQSPLPDLPCEAKIYLTHFHSSFLLSPAGHSFLVQQSKAFDVKVRLDWTSVGHVLVIFGLPKDQDNFHRQLLLKYRELSDQMSRKRIEGFKVPKRPDVLIRFLRDNINQLLTNLGNVNVLQQRIKRFEKQRSRSGLKMAEKCRRLLNMILLGQAGLCDGSLHLDKLLLNLRTLITDYQADSVVPNELREEIDSHSKVIFTSYRHDNYPELINTYNKLILKNRIEKLNIDPQLLGAKMLDTNLTDEQRQRLEMPEFMNAQDGERSKTIVPNPLNPKNIKTLNKKNNNTDQTPTKTADKQQLLNSPPTPPAPRMKMKTSNSSSVSVSVSLSTAAVKAVKGITTTSPQSVRAKNKSCLAPPPFTNPEQKSTAATDIKNAVNLANLLPEDEDTTTRLDSPNGSKPSRRNKQGNLVINPPKGPSMFWSRESMKYLDECIKLAKSNVELSEKLQRILEKSQSGALSYNDYRAVIRLYSVILGK